ncbi:hypothetical protein [Methylomagnum sp.]
MAANSHLGTTTPEITTPTTLDGDVGALGRDLNRVFTAILRLENQARVLRLATDSRIDALAPIDVSLALEVIEQMACEARDLLDEAMSRHGWPLSAFAARTEGDTHQEGGHGHE